MARVVTAVDPARVARAYLLRVAEPPAPALTAFVAEVGGPVAAAALVRAQRVPPAVEAETQARHAVDRAADDLAAAVAVGARLVTPEDDEWPAWPFAAFWPAGRRGVPWAVPPLALWVRGSARLDDATASAVAVVGARAATGYGVHVAGQLAHDLAAQAITVVSGAAYGIDGAAHRGALAGGGATIAVLACGVDVDYPVGHGSLLRRIATAPTAAPSAAPSVAPSVTHDGADAWGSPCAVVSEYPPGTSPARHRFLVRNRVIAALAEGTVVVEAGARSGARNTASAAIELGKVLMAVPGPVTSAVSRGCHELIRSGAAVAVDGAGEVAESIGRALCHPNDGWSLSNARAADERVDGRVSDARAADGRAAEGRATDARAADGGAADGRVDARGVGGGGSDGSGVRAPDVRAPTVRPPDVRDTDGLDPAAVRVHGALRPRAGRAVDRLARESGVPVAKVRAVLPVLEQRGLAVRDDTGWRLTRIPR